MVEFWLGTFPVPGRIAEIATMAEDDGWDGLAFFHHLPHGPVQRPAFQVTEEHNRRDHENGRAEES